MELAVEVVAIPDGNAGLVFEFENEVAPAVQDLNIVAFEGRVGQYHNIIDAVAIGCEYIRDPDVGVGNKNGDERGVDTAEVVGNGECNLLRAALRKTDALVCALEVKAAAVRENPGPGAQGVQACAGISKLYHLIDIRINGTCSDLCI